MYSLLYCNLTDPAPWAKAYPFNCKQCEETNSLYFFYGEKKKKTKLIVQQEEQIIHLSSGIILGVLRGEEIQRRI